MLPSQTTGELAAPVMHPKYGHVSDPISQAPTNRSPGKAGTRCEPWGRSAWR